MSIPDNLILRYLEFATAIPREEIAALGEGLAAGTINPRDAKMRLGKALVAQYHSASEAEEAARWFSQTFGARAFPEDAPIFTPPREALEEGARIWIVRLLTLCGAVPSSSEANRVIHQGGVEVDGEVVSDRDFRLPLDREHRLRVGKRRFFRVSVPRASA